MSALYIISDLHLGSENKDSERQKEEKLLALLKRINDEEADLFIAGDFFDFWFEYRHVVPRRHFRILGRLAEMAHKMPIHYLAGNHDFWLDSFMSQEIGLIIHPGDFAFSYGGCRIFSCHGDGLLRSDHGYRLLKRVLRSPINTALYRALHPDFGIPFALFCSRLSRDAGAKEADRYRDDDYRRFAYEKIEQGYDIVIMGHTHWPALEAYRSGIYLNGGYWGKDFTLALLENGVPQLLRWSGRDFEPFTATLPPGNLKHHD